jgi:Flp pilus assembly protein TadD
MLSIAFSPDGTGLAAGTQNNQALVYDARPLTDELRAELNDVNRVESMVAENVAGNLVDSLFEKYLLRTDVIAALKADTTISESVRNKATDWAHKRHGSLRQLNNRSWSVVSKAGLTADQYQLALRYAEGARELAPDDGPILNTLGVAQYRIGKYAEAVATLFRSDELNSKSNDGSEPADIAFLAIAHFQLGHTDRAHKLLEQLRQLMQTDKWKGNAECQGFFAEAVQIIIRTPAHAEQPAKRKSTDAGGGGPKL